MSMKSESPAISKKKRMMGIAGAVLLLLIIPVKLMRMVPALGPLTDLAPSVLGPAGLFFMILARAGKPQVLTTALLTGALSIILELAQMLPRPGILAKVHYTFDIRDLIASILSVAVSAALAVVIMTREGKKSSEDQ
ncbi:hypothetical protein JW906_01355 [bacterium]|nr:hypothetical protein [bacterium]